MSANSHNSVGTPKKPSEPKHTKTQDKAQPLVLGMVAVLSVALVFGAAVARRPPVAAPLTTVRIAGDATLLTDPGVAAELGAHGLQVTQNYLGSRAVALDPKLPDYDMASVSTDDAASQVQQRLISAGITESTKRIPMGTPMIVFTYKPIAQLLQRIGMASQGPDGTWTFDMADYIKTVTAKTRWSDIPGNTGYPSTNQILLSTTDPSESGSGELFLMVLSYLLNSDAPVTSTAAADRILPQIVPFYQDQGDMPIHTPDLLDEFLTGGMDRYPMIFGYEGDYLALVIDKSQNLPSDLVVMYPTPTAFSETAFVSWTPAGNALNSLLVNDPVLVNLEIQNGQRTPESIGRFVSAMAAHGITVPAQLDEVQPPTDAILEYLIEGIQRAQQQAGSD